MGNPTIPITCLVGISTKRGKPIIEIRRTIVDLDDIKLFVYAALQERPILIQPAFNNKLQSVAKLLDKGIIYFDKETDQYYFTL